MKRQRGMWILDSPAEQSPEGEPRGNHHSIAFETAKDENGQPSGDSKGRPSRPGGHPAYTGTDQRSR